jgi:hypothetical protein
MDCGVMRLPLGLAQTLAVSTLACCVSAPFAVSGQPESFDQRLLFDPGILASTPSIVDDVSSDGSKSQAGITELKGCAENEDPGGMITPEWGVSLPSVDIPSALKQPTGSNGMPSTEFGAIDPRVSLGNFSLGFDTSIDSKPRIPFAGDTNDTGYDTSYDPKHPHPLPFIGLSAKSALP